MQIFKRSGRSSAKPKPSKTELFEHVSIPRALAIMGLPTIISQLINLIYNLVDAFFIGRAGNLHMVAATTVTLTLTLLNIAFANLFGIGGGSLIARLMGQKQDEAGKRVSAYSLRGAILLALGMLRGYSEAGDPEAKSAHYRLVREFARRFREKNGSIVCRELLQNVPTTPGGEPEPRTPEFYARRPCLRLAGEAAAILEELLAETETGDHREENT